MKCGAVSDTYGFVCEDYAFAFAACVASVVSSSLDGGPVVGRSCKAHYFVTKP